MSTFVDFRRPVHEYPVVISSFASATARGDCYKKVTKRSQSLSLVPEHRLHASADLAHFHWGKLDGLCRRDEI